MRHIPASQNRPAFKLIEVMIVVAIIGIVIGMFLPATRRAGGASTRTQCQSQMRQIAIALFNAQDAYGSMPPLGVSPTYPTEVNSTISWNAANDASVQFRLLPFLDKGNLIMSFLNANYTTSEAGAGTIATPKVYLCPADPSIINQSNGWSTVNKIFVTNYAVNYQAWGDPQSETVPTGGAVVKVPSSFPDGAATTGLVYERYGNCGSTTPVSPSVWGDPTVANNGANSPGNPIAWGAVSNARAQTFIWTGSSLNSAGTIDSFPEMQVLPTVGNCYAFTVQGMHNGMNVLMGDGSCHLVSPTVGKASWSAAITPDGKDDVGNDF